MPVNDRELVSFVVPVFNAIQRLPIVFEALVMAYQPRGQDRGNFEVIFVDDKSTDGSHDLLWLYANAVPWISLITCDQNLGPGEARNRGLKISRGLFVSFLDVDDAFDPAVFLRAAEATMRAELPCGAVSYVVVPQGTTFPGMHVFPVEPDAEVVKDSASIKRVDTYRELLDYAAVWRFVFRREFLNNLHLTFPQTRYGEDLLFLLKVAAFSGETLVYAEIGYIHYLSEGASARSATLSERVALSRALMDVLVEARISRLPAGTVRELDALILAWQVRIISRLPVSTPDKLHQLITIYRLAPPPVSMEAVRFCDVALNLASVGRGAGHRTFHRIARRLESVRLGGPRHGLGS